jgi:hypothetical protein
MFGIQHRSSGMWWMALASDPRIHPPVGSAWILDAAQARRFLSEEDAYITALLECTADLTDIEIVPLPDVEREYGLIA